MRMGSFTLVELVAVLAIVVLATGLVIGRVARTPVFYSVEKAANETAAVFVDAGTQALAQGRTISVTYEPESRKFSINNAAGNAAKNKFYTCQIPDFMTVEIQNGGDAKSSFMFFPDGTASGPDVRFSMRGRSVRLSLSPLTGMVLSSEGGSDG